MVRLTRLRIDRFRNVKPGTDLRFGPTFNMLLGKNATGKSTLLDLIAAVTNDDLSGYAKEDAGFDLTWWLARGEEQLEVRAVRTPAKSGALPDNIREEKEFDDVWTIALRAAGSEIGRLEVNGTRGSWKRVNQPVESFDVRAGLAVSGACHRALLAVARNAPEVWMPLLMFGPHVGDGRLDELLGTFDAITRLPFELSREGSSITLLPSWWLPTDFVVAAHAQTWPERVAVSFDEVRPLQEIPALLGFASAELCPRLLKRSQHGESVTATYQGFDCFFRRADGSQIAHELLSFGQKRLFSFLWYVAARSKFPIVADELLNGLHHEWIEICFDRLRDRQSFLSTQHPFLLDHIPVESVDSVRTTFVRCTTESDAGGHPQMAWRNFDEEEAERFFIAYQTGVQQVSEVLRSEGLW